MWAMKKTRAGGLFLGRGRKLQWDVDLGGGGGEGGGGCRYFGEAGL